jgi:hypothetical protein
MLSEYLGDVALLFDDNFTYRQQLIDIHQASSKVNRAGDMQPQRNRRLSCSMTIDNMHCATNNVQRATILFICVQHTTHRSSSTFINCFLNLRTFDSTSGCHQIYTAHTDNSGFARYRSTVACNRTTSCVSTACVALQRQGTNAQCDSCNTQHCRSDKSTS